MTNVQITMGITERRYREGSGVLHLKNGAIRCQALSRQKVRKLREKYNDYNSPPEVFWPEAQCGKPAVPGMFVCKLHGGVGKDGKPPSKSYRRSVFDILPVNLAEIYNAIKDNPDYISRKFDIQLMQSRILELLKEIQNSYSANEAWEIVSKAQELLESGEYVQANVLLKDVLNNKEKVTETWREIYEAEKILKDLTHTQVQTAKIMQSMVTPDRVFALVEGLRNVFVSGIEEYVENPDVKAKLLRRIIVGIEQLTNTSTAIIGRSIGE